MHDSNTPTLWVVRMCTTTPLCLIHSTGTGPYILIFMDGDLKSGSLSAYGYNAVNLQAPKSRSRKWHMKRTLFIAYVSVLMVVTGTINTLATK